MSSGPGVPKPRRENDVNRQVGALSKHWRPMDGSMTGPMGTAFSQLERPDQGVAVTAWQGPGGHHAEVEQDLYSGGQGPYSGMEHNRYVAGPFRTPARAQIAGEALANRAESNPYDMDAAGTAKYENDSWMEHGRRR